MGDYCGRPDPTMVLEGLRKDFGIQSLMSCSGHLEGNAESSVEEGSLTPRYQREI